MKEEIEAKKEKEIYLNPIASNWQNRDLNHCLSKKAKAWAPITALKVMWLVL